MFISSLRLSEFRNINSLYINNFNKLNFFYGQNGEGKTNTLESLFISVSGSSFRSGDREVLIKENSKNAFIEVEVLKQNLKDKINLGIGSDKIEILLNEKKVLKKTLRNNFFSIIFQPEHLNFIKGDFSTRRSFLDESILSVFPKYQKDYSYWIKNYKTKNHILLQLKKKLITKEEAKEQLSNFKSIYLDSCLKITLIRLNFLREIKEIFIDTFKEIGGFSEVEFSYEQSEKNLFLEEEKLKKTLQQNQSEKEEKELLLGSNLFGAHRDEWNFVFKNKNARFYSSQGQQRLLILSFKLSEAVFCWKKHQIKPVLFLDDVISELDLEKQEKLFKFIDKMDFQSFITLTHKPAFISEKSYPKAQFYCINKGCVS